jgi:alkylation response protein AidB-like acyl-CoA dehydrogenase
MDFDYTDEQKLLRRTVRDFANERIRPFASEWDRKAEFPMDLIPVLAEMGFMGPTTPEEYGGMGLDHISSAIVTEEINAADASIRTLMSVHHGLVACSIFEWGDEAQKRYYLPKLARAEMIGCFGLTEPNAGSWVAGMQTRVADDGGSIIVNGTKSWISSGQLANLALVFGQMDPEKKHAGIVAFLVEKGTPGFRVGRDLPKMGAKANHATELIFEDCRIPSKNIIGGLGNGFKVAMAGLDHGRYSVAAGSVGIAQECLDLSVKYANERVAFGTTIGHHQLIRQKIARMAVDIDSARLLVYRAGHLKNKGVRSTRETSMAKWFATEIANRAAYECIQIFGANGYSTEFPIERMYRDIRVTPIYEGTSEIHQLIIADYELGVTKDKPTPALRVKEPGEVV